MSDSPRRKPRKLRKGPGRACVDESEDPSSTMASSISEGHNRSRSHDQDSAFARQAFDQSDSELPALSGSANAPEINEEYLHAGGSEGAEVEDEGSTMDERAMRRHFMDVESSFLPEAVAGHGKDEDRLGVDVPGADDTYLELGKPGHTPPPDQMFASLSEGRRGGERFAQRETEQESEDASSEEHGDDERETTSEDSAERTTSSPAAAAWQRGHARNGSAATAMYRISGHSSRPTTPGQRPESNGSTIKPEYSPQSSSVAADEHGTETTPKSRLRPSILANRQTSQFSAISTATGNTDLSGSDAAEYGTRRGQFMNRLPSFASGIDSDAPPTLSRGVSGVSALASMRRGRNDGNDKGVPETPRQANGNFDAPTDTVLAQHVQNIQVPETIARDFRARNRGVSPEKQRPLSSSAAGGAPTQGAPRRTLTLKEQNGKIDKLTKENFDLKLKIHFLDQALQSRSDDGVKELIDKNVQFQTDLANERKESQSLKRKMRELERKIKDQDENLAQMQAQHEQERKRSRDNDDEDDPTLQAEMHEEILYLRQQLDYSENKVTTLTEDVMTKELEKRKMAEHMRSMAGSRGEDTAGMKETMDMWQDLLNAETGRREQAEDDIRKLREELTAIRLERASPAPNKVSRRRGGFEEEYGEGDEYSNGMQESSGMLQQLKHENAELRKDLGAQTSMLTSRNRERERLQQEIEDLKLYQRKGGDARSLAGESIFERSISRAHNRAPSRASEAPTQVTETEREDWDKKEGHLRDQNAELRLKFQELERTHNTHLQYVSVLEGDYQEMENELNEASEDLRALQTERDEALQAFEEKEKDLENLEQEALAEIDKLEKEIESLQSQLQDALKRQTKTQSKLEHTTDGYKGLQGELREITQSVMNLEDEKQANMRTIQTLEEQIAETEDELQKWEQKSKETDQKNHKLEVTQESLHSEITFLREEQEGDKIKIGELEDALNAAQQQIQDEQEKLREVEEGIVEERQQRDTLENKSKADVQRVLDDLNTEGQKTKDEVRKLRRALSAKEVESNGWKQKLDELEASLREVLGEPEGTRQSLLSDIEKVQRDLELTTNSLDRAKMEMADKDRLLRHRDGLLESTSLESRRLSDLLDKERASRKRDLEQFEKASRGQATSMRTIAQQESRVMELEAAFTQDKRKMATLEQQYRDQLSERNNLLLALWNRLSTLCGADWAQSHSLVEGEVPSVEVIARRLPAFNKNLIAAVKMVESLMGTFKTRIRGIEKDLWKDYQTLEHNLDMRIRRMDSLEKAVREAQAAIAEERQRVVSSGGGGKGSSRGAEEIARLKSEVKVLKAELKFHRQHPSPMASQMINNQQAAAQNEQLGRRGSTSAGSIGSGGGKSTSSPARNIVANLLRHHSTSAVETLQQQQSRNSSGPPMPAPLEHRASQPLVLSTTPAAAQPSEQRWAHRLKELERRLKAEREARLLDRRGARQRLEEGRLENEELKLMLEHERVRREGEMEDGEGEGEVAEGKRREREGEVSSGVD